MLTTVKFILFDMIGTTVMDSNLHSSLILESFQEAFKEYRVDVGKALLHKHRGKTKTEAILSILKEREENEHLVQPIYRAFIDLLLNRIESFQEFPRTTELFEYLKQRSILIGIGSGLPLQFMKHLMASLGWNESLFSFIASSEDLPAGRPDPVMIHRAMSSLDIVETKSVLKVGDTKVDVEEGKRAGVYTAFVRSGSQELSFVEDLRPDYVLDTVVDLLDLIE